MSPRDLVCARCWHDFFDTEAFEVRSANDSGLEDRRVCTRAVSKDIQAAGCNWCSYVRSFIDNQNLSPEDIITTSLGAAQWVSCTPTGGNVFHFDIDCKSPTGKWIGGYSLFIHAWTTADDFVAESVTARAVRTDVDSKEAKAQIKTWIDECDGHEHCAPSTLISKLPTRVIEIDPPGRQHPRLLESSNLLGVYATLSYCWGVTPFPTLTRSNYDPLKDKLDVSTLPPTFRDAITTAQNCSIPYLWIDALCIIQDSEEDKIKEISAMNEIFASSAVTIVAASSKSAFEGFLHPRVHSEPFWTVPVRIKPGVFGTMSVNELRAACYDERVEPIAKRAWTMQEQLLAHRTLTFTSRTMMWKCASGTKNFGNSLYFPHDLDSGYNEFDEKYSLNLDSLLPRPNGASLGEDGTLSSWLRLVTVYSLRTATQERDKLNALAGIASHASFTTVLGPEYYAGLWQYNLALQLMWRISRARSHRTLPDDHEFTYYRPVAYRAPSWSWASLEGGIIYFDFLFDDEYEVNPEVICEILGCEVRRADEVVNPFGKVVGAELRVRGKIRKAWFDSKTSNVYFIPEGEMVVEGNEEEGEEEKDMFTRLARIHRESFMKEHPDIDLVEEPEATDGNEYGNMCGTYDESGSHDPAVVFCVAVTSSDDRNVGVEGLILVQAEGQGGGGGGGEVFRRIGRFELGKKEDFGDAFMREICIV